MSTIFVLVYRQAVSRSAILPVHNFFLDTILRTYRRLNLNRRRSLTWRRYCHLIFFFFHDQHQRASLWGYLVKLIFVLRGWRFTNLGAGYFIYKIWLTCLKKGFHESVCILLFLLLFICLQLLASTTILRCIDYSFLLPLKPNLVLCTSILPQGGNVSRIATIYFYLITVLQINGYDFNIDIQ